MYGAHVSNEYGKDKRFKRLGCNYLPLRLCPGSSMPEPYQSPDWGLGPAQPA